MRKFVSLLIILFMVNITNAKDEEMRIATWEKVVGWAHPDIDLYIDISTVKHNMSDGEHHSFAMLLFRRKTSVLLKIPGGPLLTNSFARYYIVDCNKALAAPLADFYFNTKELPVVTDVPDRAFDYTEDDPLDVRQVSKSDVIFKTMCPKFI